MGLLCPAARVESRFPDIVKRSIQKLDNELRVSEIDLFYECLFHRQRAEVQLAPELDIATHLISALVIAAQA